MVSQTELTPQHDFPIPCANHLQDLRLLGKPKLLNSGTQIQPLMSMECGLGHNLEAKKSSHLANFSVVITRQQDAAAHEKIECKDCTT